MLEIIQETFFETLGMMPLLLAIYIGIELAEYKFGDRIISKVKISGPAGPLLGAIAGIFPQCGFSVIATALYTQRLLTTGTLLAVYISTSDEALPLILSQPGKAGIILPLLLTKFTIAIIGGYAIDFAFRKSNKKVFDHIADYSRGKDDKNHHHETALEKQACCGHSASATSKKFKPAEILFHPIIHTLKIFFFILAISLAINISIESLGDQSIISLFDSNIYLAPVLAAFIGLIPSCAASVAITEVYLQGLISYGAVISGLCASAGLGILVLIKEEKNRMNVVRIIALLIGISIASGLLIQYYL
ncbi:MAG: putative manganese transporter [Candidatus Paceibacterota bacterium]